MAFPDDVLLVRTANNTNVTTKTATASIHPADVGGISDRICDLFIELYGLLAAAGNLQAVTALGNSTTLGIYSGSGSFSAVGDGILIASNTIAAYQSGVKYAYLSAGGAIGAMGIIDAVSGLPHVVQVGTLTGIRKSLLPDEGNPFVGSPIDSTIVLHKTKDPITVGTATDGVVYDKNIISVYKSGLVVASIDCTGSTPLIKFIDDGTGFYSTIKAGTLSADRVYLGPDKGGTFAMTSDILNLLTPTPVKTANYSAAAGEFVPVDTSSGAITVTLPTAPADKTTVGVKMVKQATTNAVTIATGGSDVFDIASGATSISLLYRFQGAIMQYVAATSIWYIVSDDQPVSALDNRYVTASGTTTFTNKRNTTRIQSATTASTLAVNADNFDAVVLTALGSAVTISAPTGTPNDMDLLAYRLKDLGGPWGITWNAIFRDGSTVTKPTTTAAGATTYVIFSYNSAAVKWDLMSVNQF